MTLLEYLQTKLPNIIHRHDNCWGFKLFQFGQRMVQVWFCPRGYLIERHSHEDQDIELAFVYGRAIFCKTKGDKVKSAVVSGFGNPFHTFSVPAGTIHWFSVSDRPLIFINYSKWKKGIKPTSAAIDFKRA